MAKGDSYAEERGETNKEEGKYGCFGWYPGCLQGMNTIKAYVFWLCVFNFWEGFIVNGAINVVLVALETRYSLSSIESGLIASANDFGAFVFLLLVGYFGEKRHKPRIMAAGTIIMAVGCLLFSLPQFLGNKYTILTGGSNNDSLCDPTRDLSECGSSDENEDSRLYPIFLVGQIILGIGAAPLFTIGLTYIDENTKVTMMPFYTGLTSCAAAVGVALGYVVGGQSLSLFVDINHGETGSPLTPKDKQWVGAWWMGSAIAMVALFLVTFPILGFPKRLPGYKELLVSRKSEAHDTGLESIAAKPDFGTTIKDFPQAIYLLLRNPTFLFLCLGGTSDALIIGGTATFGAKLLQELFNVDLSTAGWIMGAITVPGSGGGMILGGYLVRRWKLKCRGILRLCMAFTALSLLFSPAWLAQCDQINMAGLRSHYDPGSNLALNNTLVDACNSHCSCTTKTLDAICAEGLVYFSPCYAGCNKKNETTDTYTDCSCFKYFRQTVDDGVNIQHKEPTVNAKKGDCTETCTLLFIFCVCFFFIMVCTFSTLSPNVTAVFRCVPFSQRSLAIGFELLFIRLAGTTPGPILFGFVIDSACSIWEDNCGERGSCWSYQNSDMTIRILYWWISLKVSGILFYGMASLLYKAPANDKAFHSEDPKSPQIAVVSDGKSHVCSQEDLPSNTQSNDNVTEENSNTVMHLHTDNTDSINGDKDIIRHCPPQSGHVMLTKL